jgi:DNA-binding Lrp family transcriptional regulator
MSVLHNQCLAYIEITCRPGTNIAVATELAADAHALSVELTAGSADVFVTAAAADLNTMSRYLLERLGRVDGITGTKTRVATCLYTEGSAWRLGVLRREAVEELPRSRSTRAEAPLVGPLTDADRVMLVELGNDGRASYAELAERSGVSAPTVRRHVTRLLESGAVLPRTDVAAPLLGYPVLVNLWATAPVGDLAETARQLARLRQVRLCVTLAAAPSLLVSCWLRTVEEVHRFELAVAGRLRQIEFVDRLLVLRTVKRMGRLLDATGRAVGTVPMDVWRDPV